MFRLIFFISSVILLVSCLNKKTSNYNTHDESVDSIVSFNGNPILCGFADPHMRVFNGKMYVSVGKDKKPDQKTCLMPYWEIYSSDNLLEWKLETTIRPENTYIASESDRCWASDIFESNGKYFFYFSNGSSETGVLVADRPEGPYYDVLKKPMIPSSYSDNHEYDPTIFEDSDGIKYIIFGRDGGLNGKIYHYQIAPLNQNMLSLADDSRNLLTDRHFGFGNQNRAKDHQYFHKYGENYYLSCGGDYMTSKNVYGPFERLRTCFPSDGHSSYCEYNGQTYRMYELECEKYGNRKYRQVSLTYLHYKKNGDMVTDLNFLQGTGENVEGKYFHKGVANYCSTWPIIEAEWFFSKSGKLIKSDSESVSNNFQLENIYSDDYIVFPHISDMTTNMTINFSVSTPLPEGCLIEVHKNNPDGDILGICNINNTKSFYNYQIFSCKLKNSQGINDLCFVFKGPENKELLRFDYFYLK